MHKVFINDKPLIFENVYSEISKTGELHVISESDKDFKEVIKIINKEKTAGVLYLCARPDHTWSEFVSRFTLVEAAGGVVRNNKDEVLIIYRKGKWDLPKGKLDYAETPESAAVREVKEECGVDSLLIEKFLQKTFHTYTEKNKNILKKTHWYAMYSEDEGELTPQKEENIEEAKWMEKDVITQVVFKNTYSAIIDVLKNYFG